MLTSNAKFVSIVTNININSCSLLFLLGICAVKIFYYNKFYFFLILATLLICLCILYYKFNKYKDPFLCLIIYLSIINIGFLWMCLHISHFKYKNSLTVGLENKNLLVEGKIISIPYLKIHKISNFHFDFAIHKINNHTISPLKVSLEWFNSNHKAIYLGEVWQLCVNLKKPRNFYTEGSFDLEKYFFASKIHMKGQIVPCSYNLIKSKNTHNLTIEKLRESLINNIRSMEINKLTKSPSQTGLMLALGAGFKYFIDPKILQIFQDTGTAHLLVVSGLHIGLLINLLIIVVEKIFLRLSSSILLQKIPANIISALVGIIMVIFYSILAGLNVATFRAMIMTNITLGAIIMRKIINAKQAYFLSMLIILIVDPFVILLSSFWLSFIAVGVLLYSYKDTINQFKILSSKKSMLFDKIFILLKTNHLISIGLLPINVLLFGKISLIAYIANLIAIPMVSILVLPSILIGFFLLTINTTFAQYFIVFANYNLNILLIVLKFLLNLPWANIELSNLSLSNFSIGFLGSLLFTSIKVTHKDFLKKYLAIICFLPLFFPKNKIETPNYGDVFISILDVGQGLGIVIKLKNHILLYDVGPNNDVMLNYLKNYNHNKIDKIIISHTDTDHIGNLKNLADRMIINDFFTNIDNYHLANLRAKFCTSDLKWEIDGVNFQFLAPNKYYYKEPNDFGKFNQDNSKKKNDSSCVLKVYNDQYSVLLTGDISAKLEKLLIKKYQGQLKADLLLIPHHGSISSSSIEFITQVNPKYAVVSAGLFNKYHHPRKEVLARYLDKNIMTISTVTNGSIYFKFLGNGFKNNKNNKNNRLNLEDIIKYSYYKMTNINFWNY